MEMKRGWRICRSIVFICDEWWTDSSMEFFLNGSISRYILKMSYELICFQIEQFHKKNMIFISPIMVFPFFIIINWLVWMPTSLAFTRIAKNNWRMDNKMMSTTEIKLCINDCLSKSPTVFHRIIQWQWMKKLVKVSNAIFIHSTYFVWMHRIKF